MNIRGLLFVSLLALLLAPPGAAVGEEQGVKTSLIGSGAPDLSQMAHNTAKRSLYFLGAILAGVALYSRLRRRENGGANERISVVARRNIGSRSALLLVEVEGRKLLLAQSAESVTLLAPIEAPFEIPERLDEDSLSVVHG